MIPGRAGCLTRRPGSWPGLIVAITLAGAAVRVIIIAHSHGGADLGNYVYFSRLALHGVNPFFAPLHGTFPRGDANNPPIEVAVYAGLLWLKDSPDTIRALFVLADAGILLLVGLAFDRPRAWRLGFVLFYAFNPFVLVAWTTFAEDKTVLFLGVAAWVLALERGWEWRAWSAAAALTVFKFMGAFAAPAMALHSWRRLRWAAALPIGAYLVVFALGNLPWFPRSLDAFSRRDARLGLDPPLHASPMILLSRLGLYAPVEVKILTAASVVLVLILFALRRIDIREAVVLSILAGFLFLPDDAFDRILMVTLPFMLLLDYSLVRWVALWVLSSAAALAAIVAARGVPHFLSSIGGPLRHILGHESTVPHVLWVNSLLVLVLAFYLADRRQRPFERFDHGVVAVGRDLGQCGPTKAAP